MSLADHLLTNMRKILKIIFLFLSILMLLLYFHIDFTLTIHFFYLECLK
jgi:hypothetical protein